MSPLFRLRVDLESATQVAVWESPKDRHAPAPERSASGPNLTTQERKIARRALHKPSFTFDRHIAEGFLPSSKIDICLYILRRKISELVKMSFKAEASLQEVVPGLKAS